MRMRRPSTELPPGGVSAAPTGPLGSSGLRLWDVGPINARQEPVGGRRGSYQATLPTHRSLPTGAVLNNWCGCDGADVLPCSCLYMTAVPVFSLGALRRPRELRCALKTEVTFKSQFPTSLEQLRPPRCSIREDVEELTNSVFYINQLQEVTLLFMEESMQTSVFVHAQIFHIKYINIPFKSPPAEQEEGLCLVMLQPRCAWHVEIFVLCEQ